MARQSVLAKKKRGPAPTGKGEQVFVRLQPDLLKPLDAWIAEQDPPLPTRAAALRVALRDWLTGLGLLKHRDDPEGAN
jgi:hypothetical protein